MIADVKRHPAAAPIPIASDDAIARDGDLTVVDGSVQPCFRSREDRDFGTRQEKFDLGEFGNEGTQISVYKM